MQVSIFIAPVCDTSTIELTAGRLAEADRLRLQGMHTVKRRSEFLSGRLLARQSLTELYGEQAAMWRLETQPSGALHLSGMHGTPAISLSHSKERIACAVAEATFLGVDIERIQARKHLPALAAEVLHRSELADFSRLEGDRQVCLFYEKWVMKEALGKALGCGINYPMHEILFQDEHLMAAPLALISSPENWRFSHTLLPGGYSLGVAWQGDPENSVSIESVEIRL